MSFVDLLKPRQEVLSDEGIDGIIDLANLGDTKAKSLRRIPSAFLLLPTRRQTFAVSFKNYQIGSLGEMHLDYFSSKV